MVITFFYDRGKKTNSTKKNRRFPSPSSHHFLAKSPSRPNFWVGRLNGSLRNKKSYPSRGTRGLELYTLAICCPHENILVAFCAFSANVATALLLSYFDVGPTLFQRFYKIHILIAINVLLGLNVTICSRKERNENFLVVAKSSPFPCTINPNSSRCVRCGKQTLG